MDKKRIIEKLDWLFKSALSAPDPTSKEFKEEQYLFFENYVHFLQDNGFTTRTILKENEKGYGRFRNQSRGFDTRRFKVLFLWNKEMERKIRSCKG